MKKWILMLVVLFATFGFSQEFDVKLKSEIPENVNLALDGLLKTKTSNNIFSIKYIESYFYTFQQAVYVNVLFSAEIDEDAKELKTKFEADFNKKKADYDKFVEEKLKELEETNKKIEQQNKGRQKSKKIPKKTWEKPPEPKLVYPKAYHNLYLRIVKDGKKFQNFKSPMQIDDKKAEYFSFGLILEPGKYEIPVVINRYDNSKDGTLFIELEVPKLTLKDIVMPAKNISNSKAVFYKKVNNLLVAEKRFTVLKNKYHVSPQKLEFLPYLKNEFRSKEKPYLTFFMIGTVMVKADPPWNVSATIQIKQGKKKIAKYKEMKLKNPYFFQQIEFVATKKDKKEFLEPGDYTMVISLQDKNNRMSNGKVEIQFKIVE